MRPQVTEITTSDAHPGRDVLFERVDHFSFVAPQTGRMLVQSLPLPGVTIATVQSTGHNIALREQNHATLLMPLKGRIGVEAEGASLQAHAGGAMFLRPGFRTTHVRADASGEFHAAVLLVPDTARRHPSACVAPSPCPPGRAFATAADDPAAGAITGFMGYILAELARPESPVHHPPALASAAALLRDLFGDVSRSAQADLPPTPAIAAQRVRMAEEIMRARADEALTMRQIAHAVGVSTRAMQAGFRAQRGTTPHAILTAIRLDRARERLLRDPPGVSVTQIALASGFAHFGRFAAAYRARFGETPSGTRQRAGR